MFSIACCLVVGLGLGLGLELDWLVSCYAHVLVRLWVVIVTDCRLGDSDIHSVYD